MASQRNHACLVWSSCSRVICLGFVQATQCRLAPPPPPSFQVPKQNLLVPLFHGSFSLNLNPEIRKISTTFGAIMDHVTELRSSVHHQPLTLLSQIKDLHPQDVGISSYSGDNNSYHLQAANCALSS